MAIAFQFINFSKVFGEGNKILTGHHTASKIPSQENLRLTPHFQIKGKNPSGPEESHQSGVIYATPLPRPSSQGGFGVRGGFEKSIGFWVLLRLNFLYP